MALATTVKENKKKYTDRDASKTTLARKLQDVTGVSARDLVIAVRLHIINCPVTAAHAKMAEDIFGPSIVGVRGKTVKRNEPSFEVDQIPINIEPNYREVTIGMNIFDTNSIRYFASIPVHIEFGIIQKLVMERYLRCFVFLSFTSE